MSDGDDRFLLEPSRDIQERWLHVLAKFAFDHMARLEEAPAAAPVGDEGARIGDAVSHPIAEDPLAGGIDAIVSILDRAAGASLNAPGAGYFAYIPGGGIYGAALADFVADCLNRYTGMASPAPALFRLERDVLAWLCRSFGYGDEARALLTPGGSLANLAAAVSARHQHFGDGGHYERV